MINISSENKTTLGFSILTALREAKSLDKNLIEAMYYVDPKNLLNSTYSICAKEIIVGACLSIEAIVVEFARLLGQPLNKSQFGKEFGQLILTNNWDKDLMKTPIAFRPLIEYKSVIITPWQHKDKKMPEWWTHGYNLIKHNGNCDISICTYNVAVEALAALYALIGFIVLQTEFIELKSQAGRLNDQYFPKCFNSIELDILL